MVGGDSNSPASKRGARKGDAAKAVEDSDEEDSAASYIAAEKLRSADPGDREEPLRTHHGDPWEAGITDLMRARRLETRKFTTVAVLGSTMAESMYRIDRFRRFLPNRGADSRGLVQFWGPRAVRQFIAGEEPPPWDVLTTRKLHTVNVGDITFARGRR